MFCVWGRDRILFHNDASAAVFQESIPVTTIGQPLKGVAVQGLDEITVCVEQVFATGQPLQQKNRQYGEPDLFYRPNFAWSYSPVWNDAGQVAGVFATGSPVCDAELNGERTLRSQTEQTLRDQRAILETVLRQAADAIIVCNAAGEMAFANREARRLAQFDPQDTSLDIDFRDWGTAYDADGNQIPLDRYAMVRALQGESTNALEVHMVRPDGSSYDILISAAPLWDAHQNIIGAVGSFIDITQRRLAEAALRASEERFRDLADNISQFAWMTDPSGWIFWYNKRWFDYTGTTLEQMQGWGWQQVHHPDHVDRVVAKISRCYETGEPWEDTFPLRGKDGTYRWFLSRALPIRDQSGRIRRWFGTNTDITELKQAEAALAQREAELRLVTNAAPALIAFVDADQHYRYNNDRYQDWLGLAAEDLCGKPLQEVFAPEDYQEVRPYIEQVLTGQLVEFERHVTFQDGRLHCVTVTYVPRFNQQGTVEGFVSLVNDISDRKRAEKALRCSEDRLRMAIESAHLGIWDWNLMTNELTWDDECKRMFGLPEDAEITIETFFARLHPDDHDRLLQVVQESLDPANGGNYDTEFRTCDHPDGATRWVLAKGQVYFDPDQTPRRFTGTVLDITEQKQYEYTLLASETLARARAEELTAIMESTPAAIWIAHDPQCHDMTANKTAYELMGMPLGAVTTATPLNQVNSLPFTCCHRGQEVPVDQLPMQKAIRTQAEVTGELEFVFTDGTIRTIYGTAVPLYGPADQVRGAIGGFVDITALKQSEQERETLLQRERQAREEAENASRIKDEFLAILSHELRSPLNPILGWTSLLRRGQLNAAKTATALETIERNARLQIQLIDDLLDVSRIIRGKLALTMAPIDLVPTINGAIETVQLAAEAKHIAIQTQLDTTVGQVLGDSARLQQVVWNLLSNAVKFTPEHGRVTITLSATSTQGPWPDQPVSAAHDLAQTNQYAQIQVIDTGQGINPDFLPHVFEYFRQADSTTTRTFGGLGLGLAIVRYLVELHGGTVDAHSPGKGQGATFTVRLPLLRVKDAAPAAEPQPALVAQATVLEGVRVLLVEDDPDTREFLTFFMQQQGVAVTAAGSAEVALRAMGASAFDLVISDIGMPDMDGYAMMHQLRTTFEGNKDIPAIALTAYASESDRDKALAAGFQRHIPKPVATDDLMKSIAELLHP